MAKKILVLLGILILGCSITVSAQDKKEIKHVTPPWGEGNPPYREPQLIDVSYINHKFLDITYAQTSEAQKLDIYLPDGKSESAYPVIVAVHGGGFSEGDKRDGQIKAQLEGLKRGYAVVSVNYRLSGEAIFPANINDIKAAIRWIRAHAEEYNFDANNIAVWGNSAGGNLSAVIGTSGDVKELEDLSLGNADYSSRVQAAIDWYGPTNFATMDELLVESGTGEPWHSAINSSESVILGGDMSLIPEQVKAANPETYVSEDDPPFLIQHGTKDGTVPVKQSKMLYEKLVQAIGAENVQITLFEEAPHGGPSFETLENLELVYNFLDKHLK